jgi:hypothetical protein
MLEATMGWARDYDVISRDYIQNFREKPLGKRAFARPRSKCENNIMTVIRDISCKNGRRMELV